MLTRFLNCLRRGKINRRSDSSPGINQWDHCDRCGGVLRPAKASLSSVGRLAEALKIERKVFVREIKANFPVLKKSASPTMQMSDAFG